jgi:hypothetical protein
MTQTQIKGSSVTIETGKDKLSGTLIAAGMRTETRAGRDIIITTYLYSGESGGWFALHDEHGPATGARRGAPHDWHFEPMPAAAAFALFQFLPIRYAEPEHAFPEDILEIVRKEETGEDGIDSLLNEMIDEMRGRDMEMPRRKSPQPRIKSFKPKRACPRCGSTDILSTGGAAGCGSASVCKNCGAVIGP